MISEYILLLVSTSTSWFTQQVYTQESTKHKANQIILKNLKFKKRCTLDFHTFWSQFLWAINNQVTVQVAVVWQCINALNLSKPV